MVRHILSQAAYLQYAGDDPVQCVTKNLWNKTWLPDDQTLIEIPLLFLLTSGSGTHLDIADGLQFARHYSLVMNITGSFQS